MKKQRKDTPFLIEERFFNYDYLVGADEAGRGCLAGPVVAAAVAIKSENLPEISDATDSKAQHHSSRKSSLRKHFDKIEFFSAVSFSARSIDEKGISRANQKALETAVRNVVALLKGHRVLVVVDHFYIDLKEEGVDAVSFPKADSKCKPVSLASTLAKVLRDLALCSLEDEFSCFSFSCHKGYGTQKHLTEIRRFDLTPVHRKSFRPVQNQTLF